MTAAVHRFEVRVYYEDTDAAGIVYHANYLRFAERARTEWLRSLGLDHDRLRREHGVRFAVRRCIVDYLRPARLDDLLSVETRVTGASGARLELLQDISLRDGPAVQIRVTLVALDDALRPVRIARALPRGLLARIPVAAPAAGASLPDEPEREGPSWTN